MCSIAAGGLPHKRAIGSSQGDDPVRLMESIEVTVGTNLHSKRRDKPVVLRGSDALKHKQVAGISGKGKSKFLVSLAAQYINQGIGVAFVDPHGDACDDLLRFLIDTGFYSDPRAYQRVLYVPWHRQDRFVPFNVLSQRYEPHVTARLVMEAFTRAWRGLGNGQAPNMENLILAGSFVLIQNHKPLTALSRLFADRQYREALLENVTDGEIVSFFHDRYDGLGRQARQLTESSLRRIFLLSFTPSLRYALGQTRNLLDFRSLMDAGTTVLLDLRNLDPETTRLLGSLLTVNIEEAALSRADSPEDQRRPFVAIVDEFSQFSTSSAEAMERTLALVRKYGVSLMLAHQTYSQLDHKLIGALQNAMLISFGLGREDAPIAAKQLADYDPYRLKHVVTDPRAARRTHPTFMSMPEQMKQWEMTLQQLPPRQALLRLGSETVWVQTVCVPESRCTVRQLEAVKERYAQLFLTPRDQIHISDAVVGPASTGNAPPATGSTVQAPQGKVRRIVPLPGQKRP